MISSKKTNKIEFSFFYLARVINISSENLMQVIMEETGDLGVEHILDLDVPSKISKETLISCLAVHGSWVTQNSSLQVS